ncbi:SGNH/GDSL hydrolase family protein [Novosphingobium sp. TH158]|uniref:SGNH/GDSL hydrolase family protein n=1 Tax=Novosphingobium sp. TH158 TaxID=2067455 RepID=UPI000C7960B4|nr:SGNH/GDSL hydrolase family protein [Novosphingobium sp. TH158]PLK26126.1 hypothetical protein C0V78_03930 [Novosphingobium sp. TH158]
MMKALLIGLGSVSAFALAAPVVAKPVPRNAHYVAMGSSYAAGTGLGGIKPGTPQRCGRSPKSYSSLVAERLKLDYDDQTCGGATTAHILGPWNELAPQIDAVKANTRLVTITIGGNDLGYVMNLMLGSCPPGGMMVQGTARACSALRPPATEAYAKLEGNLRRIVQEIRQRAPKARVIFVQYVKLVPDTPCEVLGLTPEGAILNREIGERLAAVTARAAEAEGAEVLAAQDLSRQHTACDAAPWSVGPKPTGPDGNASWHPTVAGHAGIADALVKMLRR